jgi:hypothetical protein
MAGVAPTRLSELRSQQISVAAPHKLYCRRPVELPGCRKLPENGAHVTKARRSGLGRPREAMVCPTCPPDKPRVIANGRVILLGSAFSPSATDQLAPAASRRIRPHVTVARFLSS